MSDEYTVVLKVKREPGQAHPKYWDWEELVGNAKLISVNPPAENLAEACGFDNNVIVMTSLLR